LDDHRVLLGVPDVVPACPQIGRSRPQYASRTYSRRGKADAYKNPHTHKHTQTHTHTRAQGRRWSRYVTRGYSWRLKLGDAPRMVIRNHNIILNITPAPSPNDVRSRYDLDVFILIKTYNTIHIIIINNRYQRFIQWYTTLFYYIPVYEYIDFWVSVLSVLGICNSSEINITIRVILFFVIWTDLNTRQSYGKINIVNLWAVN
jgi:hypothetical protein